MPVATRLLDERGERRLAGHGDELVDVDAGRHLVDALDVSDHVLEHPADVLGADVHGLRAGERLGTERSSSGRPRIEYSSSEPWAFTAKRAPLARATGRAHQHVVREDDVRGQQLAQRGTVRGDVRVTLLGREVPQQARVETLVRVEHEDGQQAVRQVGHDDARAGEVVRSGCRSWQTTTTS